MQLLSTVVSLLYQVCEIWLVNVLGEEKRTVVSTVSLDDSSNCLDPFGA